MAQYSCVTLWTLKIFEGEYMITLDIPVYEPVYKTWVINVHTGDPQKDYEFEKEIREHYRQYTYSEDHKHVR